MTFFVTGTDTGVGKTVVTALLALHFRQLGRTVGVCKPFASGCVWRDGVWQSEDAVYLQSVLALPESLAQINPISLQEPLTPLVAARRASVSTLDWRARARAAIAQLAARYDVVLVEGVGGLEVPVGEDASGIWTARDFAAELDCPIILVARRGLGTLNHTLLSVKSAPRIEALIFNDAAPIGAGDVAAQTNVEMLREMTGLPVWGEVPFLGDGRDDVARLQVVASEFSLLALPSQSFRLELGLPPADFTREEDKPGEAFAVYAADDEVEVAIRQTLAALDRVQSWPAGLVPIPIYQVVKTPGSFGGFHHQDGEAKGITINVAGPHPRLTTAHEVGHRFDFDLVGEGGHFESENAENAGSVLNDWWSAVVNSRRYHDLQGDLEGEIFRDDATEFLKKRELFARSYAQYIALASEQSALQEELSNVLESYGMNSRRQWEPDDFSGIALSFDKLLSNLGMN